MNADHLSSERELRAPDAARVDELRGGWVTVRFEPGTEDELRLYLDGLFKAANDRAQGLRDAAEAEASGRLKGPLNLNERLKKPSSG